MEFKKRKIILFMYYCRIYIINLIMCIRVPNKLNYFYFHTNVQSRILNKSIFRKKCCYNISNVFCSVNNRWHVNLTLKSREKYERVPSCRLKEKISNFLKKYEETSA